MFYAILAKILAIPRVRDWLIRKAMRTPYFHLPDYMDRWWLVPYRKLAANSEGAQLDTGTGPVKFRQRPFAWFLQRFDIAIRIHHIKRPDLHRDKHDHPWNARTCILLGHYLEDRGDAYYWREAGDTAALKFDDFHSIIDVSEGGAWTLFITGPYRGVWGYLVNGGKVPHYEYHL